jgi:hypothetical protein
MRRCWSGQTIGLRQDPLAGNSTEPKHGFAVGLFIEARLNRLPIVGAESDGQRSRENRLADPGMSSCKSNHSRYVSKIIYYFSAREPSGDPGLESRKYGQTV